MGNSSRGHRYTHRVCPSQQAHAHPSFPDFLSSVHSLSTPSVIWPNVAIAPGQCKLEPWLSFLRRSEQAEAVLRVLLPVLRGHAEPPERRSHSLEGPACLHLHTRGDQPFLSQSSGPRKLCVTTRMEGVAGNGSGCPGVEPPTCLLVVS